MHIGGNITLQRLHVYLSNSCWLTSRDSRDMQFFQLLNKFYGDVSTAKHNITF